MSDSARSGTEASEDNNFGYGDSDDEMILAVDESQLTLVDDDTLLDDPPPIDTPTFVANVDDATNFDCDDSPVGSGAYFVDDLPLVAVIAIFAISFGINGLAHAILLASYAIGFQVNTDSGPNSIESSCPGTYIQVEDVVPPELAAQDQTEFADNLSSREISPDFSQSSMATLVPDRTEPQLIHDERLPTLLTQYDVPEGVQWAIAVLASNHCQCIFNLDETHMGFLQGSNVESGRHLMAMQHTCGCNVNNAASFLASCEALDEEQNLSFLQCIGGDEDSSHGGKVQCPIILHRSREPGKLPFFYELQPLEVGSSTRVQRLHGSMSLLRIRCDEWDVDEGVRAFVMQPILICGKVFRVFRYKDGNFFALRTGEKVQDGSIQEDGESAHGSLYDTLQDFNNMDNNANQPFAKWASRFELGLSSTVPITLLSDQNVIPIDDVVNVDGSTDSRHCMTDGCGYVNRAMLLRICQRLTYDACPTAVQARIGGYKGLWVLHPSAEENAHDLPRIWVRPSQRKIKYSDVERVHPGRRIFEVIKVSRLTDERSITHQIIINLSENGVPEHLFKERIDAAVNTAILPFTDFLDTPSCLRLRHHIASKGKLDKARKAEEAANFRAREGQDWSVIGEDREPSEYPDRSNMETAVQMLDAGFMPQHPYLAHKLVTYAVPNILRNLYTEETAELPPKLRIPIPHSCFGFLVPDPSHLLKPGEIYVQSTRPLKVIRDGRVELTNILTGDVLVTRSPCILRTDIQKMRAVCVPALSEYKDVIVFSVQGEISSASLLSGGDYDGDEGLVIYDGPIVNAFSNAELTVSAELPEVQEQFCNAPRTVSTFLDEHDPDGTGTLFRERPEVLQDALLESSISSRTINAYYSMLIYAKYMLPPDDLEILRLGQTFTKLMELKSGLTLNDGQLSKDKEKYGQQRPNWRKSDNQDKSEKGRNLRYVVRPGELGAYIMDILSKHAQDIQSDSKDHVRALYLSVRDDETEGLALSKPYADAQFRADKYLEQTGSTIARDELQAIEEHVATTRKTWSTISTKRFAAASASKSAEEQRHIRTKLRQITCDFASGPAARSGFVHFGEDEVERVKASFACIYELKEHHGSDVQFPFTVAFRQLCELKGRGGVMISKGIYPALTVHRSWIAREE